MKALEIIGAHGFSNPEDQSGNCISYAAALQHIEHHYYRESIGLLLKKYNQDHPTDLSHRLDETNTEIAAYFVKMWQEGYFEKIPEPRIYPIDANLLGDTPTCRLQNQITGNGNLIEN